MSFQVHRLQVWSAEIPDRPGAAAAKLERLTQAGANLEFVITRPHPDKPDTSLIFLAPVEGAEQVGAAQEAGLAPARDVPMLCVEGENRAGIGYEMMSRLAVAGINLRGISISSLGTRFAAYLAFDNADTATMALQVLATMV
jgi:hypothetical protein